MVHAFLEWAHTHQSTKAGALRFEMPTHPARQPPAKVRMMLMAQANQETTPKGVATVHLHVVHTGVAQRPIAISLVMSCAKVPLSWANFPLTFYSVKDGTYKARAIKCCLPRAGSSHVHPFSSSSSMPKTHFPTTRGLGPFLSAVDLI